MKWYPGSVEDAVNEAKRRRSYFVVYIDGIDKLSEMMSQVINSEDISKVLENGNYVNVRVNSGSEEYKQFVELYKHVPVPSLFLIGLNGMPLAVISNSFDEEYSSLHEKVLEAIVLKDKVQSRGNTFSLLASANNKNDKQNVFALSAQGSTSSNHSTGSSSTSLQTVTFKKKDEGFMNGSYTIERRDAQQVQSDDDETVEESFYDSANQGKPAKHNKKHSEERELQQEQLRNKLDRKRVLNDIEMDKQERVARQQERKASRFANRNAEDSGKTETTPLANNQTRIQFRSSNGATYTEVFNVYDVLSELRQYVAENVQSNSQFQLATAFPRHVFTENEYTRNLLDLNLVPNAVILIIPLLEGNSAPSYLYSQLSNTFWFITSPITGLYRSIVGNHDQAQIVDGVIRRPAETATHRQGPNASNQNQRKPDQHSPKAQGKVYTMSDMSKDNNNRDRNDVWNGNSTQQIQ